MHKHLCILFVLFLSTSAFQFFIQRNPSSSSIAPNKGNPFIQRLAATAIHHETDNNCSRMPHEFSDTTNQADLVEALKEGKTLNATENVFTVDQDNNPTPNGHPRNQMRLEKLWHRATYIVIKHDYNENNDEHSDEDFLLVQRRTKIKDYCPGKLDPTPGGVVGFGESYALNATREMMEEMNIDLSEGSPNEIRELFTFPYQDDNVKVWGGMFEVTYRRPMSEIKMQPEEVSEVLRLSLADIRKMAKEDPDDWMPDGVPTSQSEPGCRYSASHLWQRAGARPPLATRPHRHIRLLLLLPTFLPAAW